MYTFYLFYYCQLDILYNGVCGINCLFDKKNVITTYTGIDLLNDVSLCKSLFNIRIYIDRDIRPLLTEGKYY